MKSVQIIFVLAAFLTVQGGVIRPTRLSSDDEEESQRKWMYIADEQENVYFLDLTQEIRHVKIEDSIVTFHYCSRNHTDPLELSVSNTTGIHYTDFDPNRKTMFIIHGWNNDKTSLINTLIRDALLEVDNWNIFVVDWKIPANGLYNTAMAAVPDVGNILARFASDVTTNLSLVHFTGHSLGAHVAGRAGDLLGGAIHTIVGLDPALPFYVANNTDERLDPTDAEYVEVIHTCAGFLGFKVPIGHSDFYPNGGQQQIGCGLDILGTCAHKRAYQYFAESIRTGEFRGTLCASYAEFEEGKCENNTEAYMGQNELDRDARGTYYLHTAKKEPFALG